jgi:hypothetical protein
VARTFALKFGGKPASGSAPDLRLFVVYTTPEATRAALRAASVTAGDLGALISLLVPQVVPFPLSIAAPDVNTTFLERSMAEIASGCEMEVHVSVLLCRDRVEAVLQNLPPQSIVLVGRRRRWGFGAYWSLIRALKREQHHAIPVDRRAAPAASAECVHAEPRSKIL